MHCYTDGGHSLQIYGTTYIIVKLEVGRIMHSIWKGHPSLVLAPAGDIRLGMFGQNTGNSFSITTGFVYTNRSNKTYCCQFDGGVTELPSQGGTQTAGGSGVQLMGMNYELFLTKDF